MARSRSEPEVLRPATAGPQPPRSLRSSCTRKAIKPYQLDHLQAWTSLYTCPGSCVDGVWLQRLLGPAAAELRQQQRWDHSQRDEGQRPPERVPVGGGQARGSRTLGRGLTLEDDRQDRDPE